MRAQINKTYAKTCTICGGFNPIPNLADDPTDLPAEASAQEGETDPIPPQLMSSLNTATTNLTRSLYTGKQDPAQLHTPTVQATARIYMHAVQSQFEKVTPQADWTTPHHNMIANIRKNVYAFAAAKNYQQMRAMTDAILDGDKKRPYADFKKTVAPLLEEYNNNWLKTEYNTAGNGAYNAAKWVDYEKSGKSINLKYITVGDARVREEHRILDGTIRPLDDEFWNTHYPPLAFNCRCTTVRSFGTKPTPTDQIPHVDIPKMFSVNLAKQNIVFPKGSPYFIGCPKDIIQQSKTLPNDQ